MKNFDKYTRNFFIPADKTTRWAAANYVEKAPIWCSVDLRDGNQALIVPMSLQEKLEFFEYLVKVGFKEIEIGFPAASDTEYEFCRALIEGNLIPDDVTIQVLTQSREHIIKKTFEALTGVKSAIVHLYNSTSIAQREQVFKKSKEEILEIATSGAELLLQYRAQTPGNFHFEYSPESFTLTELDFALEVCNAVIDVWKPTPTDKVIINLPATVQVSMPHVYASQVEYMSDHLNRRESVIVSLHPHNDRGCAIADCEMGLLAGADRIEGTLFGNGERTGNADIVTIAMNMYSQGIDPVLNFENLPELIEEYEKVTRMHVYERQPYSGQLVFAAFSGSHQDAITKGMRYRDENNLHLWNVPYLPIDPKDIGRDYDGDVIRINSQSGKGGIGFILEQKFGYTLPPKMREAFGYLVKGVSDRNHKELSPDEIHAVFMDHFVNLASPIELLSAHYAERDKGNVTTAIVVMENGNLKTLEGTGNGRLDAVNNALKKCLGLSCTLISYTEHALQTGSESQAAAYVAIAGKEGETFWGCGIDTDILTASVNALFIAVNVMLKNKN